MSSSFYRMNLVIKSRHFFFIKHLQACTGKEKPHVLHSVLTWEPSLLCSIHEPNLGVKDMERKENCHLLNIHSALDTGLGTLHSRPLNSKSTEAVVYPTYPLGYLKESKIHPKLSFWPFPQTLVSCTVFPLPDDGSRIIPVAQTKTLGVYLNPLLLSYLVPT